MNESKFLLKKSQKKEKNVLKKGIISFFNKVLISTLIFIGLLITVKANPALKDSISKNVFEKNLSFAQINKWYQDNLGGILPFDNFIPNDEVSVFDEKLSYTNASLYKDGVKLSVSNNYLVPILNSGIVVFIGEKENYGSTIIIQQVDGIDVWYSNISSNNIKLYDYVEKGNLLGEANGDFIYLSFQKDGKFLDYKEYI